LYASSLWTLQHLCLGPDVAADYSPRENRDPGKQQKKPLTKETRLENAPYSAASRWSSLNGKPTGDVCLVPDFDVVRDSYAAFAN
jgi:hypothetical protein